MEKMYKILLPYFLEICCDTLVISEDNKNGQKTWEYQMMISVLKMQSCPY